MKTKKTNPLCISIALSALVLASCTSTKADFIDFTPYFETPATVKDLPVVGFVEPGIKYEVESMLLHNFLVAHDTEASGLFAATLMDEAASAKMKVKFPAGTYECMLSEKAPDQDHSAFYVYIDDTPYRVYPSNPPLERWELTTRVPVYFTLTEPRTVLVTIQANSDHKLGHTGMSLDYIQFVKRD